MEFSLSKSLEILERTPRVLSELLSGLSEEWTLHNEGPDTWSPFDIIGHLVHGEKTDWIVRVEIILSDSVDKTFHPFDRFAQLETSKDKTLSDLLNEFQDQRKITVEKLRQYTLSDSDLAREGNHPALGVVTLKQLLATWVVHDLSHIAQISRVMAKQYKNEVGPFSEYLRVLND